MEFFVKPGEDEEWHQYWIDERTALVRRPRHRPRQPAPLRAPEGEAVATTRSAPSTSSTASASPAREWGELEGIANRTDFDLKTHSEHSGQDLSYFDQADERALHALRHRAGGRPDPRADDLPGRRLHRGRGAQHQGRRRQAHRAAARPAAGAGQGRGAAADPQRGPLAQGPRPRRRAAPAAGTSTSTTPARSAVATAARTRSARRTASPSTSTPSRTTPSPCASATR